MEAGRLRRNLRGTSFPRELWKLGIATFLSEVEEMISADVLCVDMIVAIMFGRSWWRVYGVLL